MNIKLNWILRILALIPKCSQDANRNGLLQLWRDSLSDSLPATQTDLLLPVKSQIDTTAPWALSFAWLLGTFSGSAEVYFSQYRRAFNRF